MWHQSGLFADGGKAESGPRHLLQLKGDSVERSGQPGLEVDGAREGGGRGTGQVEGGAIFGHDQLVGVRGGSNAGHGQEQDSEGGESRHCMEWFGWLGWFLEQARQTRSVNARSSAGVNSLTARLRTG